MQTQPINQVLSLPNWGAVRNGLHKMDFCIPLDISLFYQQAIKYTEYYIYISSNPTAGQPKLHPFKV